MAEIATPGVVQVASLTQDAAWRDAGDQIVEMVGGLGFDVHEVEDDSKSWPIILRAFGFWDLPLTDFFGPFLSRLPAWDKQEPLDRTLNLLLDELDHASDPHDREAVVARIRAAVRVALG